MSNNADLVEATVYSSVHRSIDIVKRILDSTRNPRLAADEDHTYDDKYHLAQVLTNTAVAALWNTFAKIGFRLEDLDRFPRDAAVTLRFVAGEACEFVKEEIEEVENPTKIVTETKKAGAKETKTVKVSNTVEKFYWKITVHWKLFCFAGSDPEEDPVVLQSNEFSKTIVTTGVKRGPIPPVSNRDPRDVDITYFLQQLDGAHANFSIDRSLETCLTPRRNEPVEHMMKLMRNLNTWCEECKAYIHYTLHRNILGTAPDRPGPKGLQNPFDAITEKNIFCPVMPLLENKQDDHKDEEPVDTETSSDALVLIQDPPNSSVLMSSHDIFLFLKEQQRTLQVEMERLETAFAEDAPEAKMVLVWRHIVQLIEQWANSIEYIEVMLRKQLISAIGKEVKQKDFEEYFRFRSKRLLGEKCKPFCYDVRRPDHYPEGLVTIELKTDGGMEPVDTIAYRIPNDASMKIPLSAATTVEFVGDQVLHGWIRHQFISEHHRSEFMVGGRARQFQSFMLLIGNISGPSEFKPRDAIILQNKDCVEIPLLLSTLPTAKDFRDAISSLSPEQQRFAKSFRGMQLESSVFGICIIQLKPQLEALLGLPPDALTKEMKLTQDLLSLFIEHQIPSDLLTFDGPPDAPDKVGVVKEHTKAVLEVIDAAKKKQLEEEVQRAKAAEAVRKQRMEQESSRSGRAPLVGGFGGGSSRGRGATVQKYSDGLERAAAPVRMSAAPVMMSAMAGIESAEVMETSAQVPVFKKMSKKISPGRGTDEAKPDATDGEWDADWEGNQVNFSAIPKKLDSIFETQDTSNSLRTTIIKTSDKWTLKRQESLLGKLVESSLNDAKKKTEKDKAFDLLDALSRSGSLPIACGELHVVVGVTHCFEDSVMDTVIQKNMNPIEQAEQSALLIASSLGEAAGQSADGDALAHGEFV